MKTLKIGNTELPNRYILAPMAGISDLPFRFLCHEFGAGLTCMEMVSAKAITYENKKTFSMLRTGEGEHPVSLQIFGSDPDIMGEVAASLEDHPFDIIDINMGCPVPKIVKNGEGSALLLDPLLAGKIIKSMSRATTKPVTVKFRMGFDMDRINAVEFAQMAEENGAAAVCIHGRTREQYYEGKANWDIIAKVKGAVKIPVIGNGDLFSPLDVKRMEEETGVDGFAIARGAKGNPWIFRDLLVYEETGILPDPPTDSEIKSMIIRHAQALIEEKGEYIGIREMRRHAAWYMAGSRNASRLRGALNTVDSIEDLRRVLYIDNNSLCNYNV